VSCEVPATAYLPHDARAFIVRVLGSVLPDEHRAVVAEWTSNQPDGGAIELAGAAVVLARTWSSSSAGLSCSLVMGTAAAGLPMRRVRPETSPIPVKAVTDLKMSEGLVDGDAIRWGEFARRTLHAPNDRYGQRNDGRELVYEAFDDSLVTGLTLRWLFGWEIPPEAGWSYLERALPALLPVPERERGRELSMRQMARAVARGGDPYPYLDRDELPSGPLEIRAEQSGVTCVWSLRQ
jgi:hypothetical protein